MQKSHKIRVVISYLLLLIAYIIYFLAAMFWFSFLLTFFGLAILLLGLSTSKPRLLALSPVYIWRRRHPKVREKEIGSENELPSSVVDAEEPETDILHKKTSKEIKEDIEGIKIVWKELEEK